MSRFTAHLGLVLIETPDGRADTKAGRAQWFVSTALPFEVGVEGSGEWITVPVGATTDLASIPWIARRLLPPDGPWVKAAVLHDYLYRTKGLGGVYTRKQSDEIFLDAMTAVGVAAWKRQIIFQAVRLGGGRGWGS